MSEHPRRSRHERRPSTLPVVLIGLLALGACTERPAGPPVHPPEISYPLPSDPASVVANARPVLESRGIEVVEADPATGIVRGHASELGDTPWAQCPNPRIQDTDGQRLRIARPRGTDLDLELMVAPEGEGSTLVVRPTFERTYLDSFRFREFTRRCQSTGVLERELASTLGAA
jgi:hypothetical protein